MPSKVALSFVGVALATGALVAGSTGAAGCGGSDSSSNTGAGASSPITSSASASSTGSGTVICDGSSTTIEEITKGNIGPNVGVKVTGVIAMSPKFLVSHSSKGSCLWGVYVSSPGLTTTRENSGVLALAYGTPAVANDAGQSYCPVLGQAPAGDAFPDDVAIGDVFDLIGTTDYFVLEDCQTQDGGVGSQVKQRQLSQICSATRTSTGAAVPAPAVVTDLASFVDYHASSTAFHDQWGGVFVEIQNVTSAPQTPATGGNPSMTDGNGNIVLAGSGLTVNDNVYYQGLLASEGYSCHSGPTGAATTTFTSINGFSTLDFCTWSISPLGKCAPNMLAQGSTLGGSADCPCSDLQPDAGP